MAASRDKTELFRSAPIPVAVAKLAVPMILSQLVLAAYNIADAFFIAKTGDPDQVAALTLCFPVYMTLTAMANLLGVGANSLAARALGAGDPERARRASTFGIFSSAAAALLLAGILSLIMEPLMTLIGASPDTMGFCKEYLRWVYIVGSVPTLLSLSLSHILRSAGEARRVGFGLIGGCILNIALDPLFIFAFDMGVAGAALATAISNAASAVYFIVCIIKVPGARRLMPNRSSFRFGGGVAKGILLVGMPSALVVILSCAANVVITHFASRHGDAVVTSYGVMQKLCMCVAYIIIGITQSIMPLIGYNYAAGRYDRVKSAFRFTSCVLVVFSLAWVAAAQLVPKPMLSIFFRDPEILDAAAEFLRRQTISTPFTSFAMLFNSTFQAMGKWFRSLVLSVLRQGLVYIPLLIFMYNRVGLYGLVWSAPISDFFACAFGAVLYAAFVKKAFSGAPEKELTGGQP